MPSPQAASRLTGKVALITGAASGIGHAVALCFGREGATAICADCNWAGAESIARAICADGASAMAIDLDVAQESSWESALELTLRSYGRLDILVNCAGIAATDPVSEIEVEAWRRVMAVNLEGVLLGTKHGMRAMRHNQHGGSIVNVASMAGVRAEPGAAAYCTSKAAVIMLTKSAALECLRAGLPIRINAISPGGVRTPMWRTTPFFQDLMAREGSEEAAFDALLRSSPGSRFAEPEEVAAAIAYLASDQASFVTGTNLLFDQGPAV